MKIKYIAIQVEVPGGGQFEFKDISITEIGYKSLFKKTGDERFLVVEDAFFDPIRKLAE